MAFNLMKMYKKKVNGYMKKETSFMATLEEAWEARVRVLIKQKM